ADSGGAAGRRRHRDDTVAASAATPATRDERVTMPAPAGGRASPWPPARRKRSGGRDARCAQAEHLQLGKDPRDDRLRNDEGDAERRRRISAEQQQREALD